MTQRIGMAVNSGHEATKRRLSELLEGAADLAGGLELWFHGAPAKPVFEQLALQIREQVGPEDPCLCGAPVKDGVCSVPDCVASQAKEETFVLIFASLWLRDQFFKKRFKGRQICDEPGLYSWSDGHLGVQGRTVSVYGKKAIAKLLADLTGAKVSRG